MADRNLNFDPTVTNVTPTMPDQGLLTGVADFGDKLAEMSANAKALNATAQTSLAFRQLDVQYREVTASNPNDPEALANLQSARSQVIQQIGQQVPAISSQAYMAKAIELGQSSDKMNEFWGMHQQIRNADSDIQTAQNTKLQMANMDGKKFGQDGADFGNLSSVMNFEKAKQDISDFLTPVVGAPKMEAALRDFSGNYVKSFVAGLAEENPQAAAAMLDQPNIKEHFTTEQIGDMGDVIKKTERQQQLIQTLQTTKNDGSLTDLANDPNTSYFEKRATIDKMDAEGSVSPKAAAAFRRVIKSSEDLDSQTDTPAMSALVNKTYDLNANASTNADDYLRGVQNLHQEVLDGQADGSLTSRDASKVTNTINNLTSKKLADATNTAGTEFYDANKMFDVLPPEYRGQATRALFYAGDKAANQGTSLPGIVGGGGQWTPDQYKNQATQIIQQINDQRRQQAMKVVNGVPQNDTDFLKSVGASESDVQETAAKHGMSTRDVILRLRADEVAKQRAKQSGVKKIVGGSEDDDKEDFVKIPEKPRSDPEPTPNIDDMEEQGLNQ